MSNSRRIRRQGLDELQRAGAVRRRAHQTEARDPGAQNLQPLDGERLIIGDQMFCSGFADLTQQRYFQIDAEPAAVARHHSWNSGAVEARRQAAHAHCRGRPHSGGWDHCVVGVILGGRMRTIVRPARIVRVTGPPSRATRMSIAFSTTGWRMRQGT